jgi:lipid-A-disaccharide synthase
MSAAEASGDEHAARLIVAIRSLRPNTRFVGVAGEKMAAAGCEVLADLTKKASMLGGPILRLGWYVQRIKRLQRQMRQIRPDIHVPVDSPAMNWHLAAEARKIGAKVIYYIAPQVWAWAPWRVRKLARLTDHVACILPFEQQYLRDRGVKATYVGHPLFDMLEPFVPQSSPGPDPSQAPGQEPCARQRDLLDAWGNGTWQIAMIPGSRPGEIKGHIKALLEVSKSIKRRWPKSQCVFTARTPACAEIIKKSCGPDVAISVGKTLQTLAQSHFAVIKSGTVTLEAANYGVPMVIFYRTSRLLALARNVLGKWAVPTPYFSLVNILAGKRLLPELTPWHGSAEQLTAATFEAMEDLGYLVDCRQALLKLVEPLRVPPPRSASDNAARLILKVFEMK